MKDDAFLLQVFGKFDQCIAWIEVAFLSKSPCRKRPARSGSSASICSESIVSKACVRRAKRRSSVVSRVGNDERALAVDRRNMSFPPANRFLPQPYDGFFRTLAFAPRGQHSACKPRTAVGADCGAFGNDSDGVARSLNSAAQARPATPAPMIVTRIMQSPTKRGNDARGRARFRPATC